MDFEFFLGILDIFIFLKNKTRYLSKNYKFFNYKDYKFFNYKSDPDPKETDPNLNQKISNI